MKNKLIEWLYTQDEEFTKLVIGKDMLGNGHFTMKDLIELDLKFNPEDYDDDRPD